MVASVKWASFGENFPKLRQKGLVYQFVSQYSKEDQVFPDNITH